MPSRLDSDLLRLLSCPETHQPLTLADAALVDAFNERIRAGSQLNRVGQLVTEPFEAGLVRADRRVLYPVRRGIPVLLAAEGLPLPGL